MIAQIESGKYIDADQLQSGVIGDIYFKPRDTDVQAITTIDISI